MRAISTLVACLVLTSFAAQAEVVRCTTRAQGQARTEVEFEVWPASLPVPDYRDAHDACVARATNAPVPAPPPSQWIENQRDAYTNALKRQPADIIVAPFQVQGYGLDRAERALMSADLAYHLDPAVRVADPFLTARALGEGARRYESSDIVELARAVGARAAVVGYVGHDRHHRMTITVQVLKIKDSGAVETVQRDWRDVRFTHADPPFVVFHRMLPSVLENLSLPITTQPHSRASVEFPSKAEFSFADLAAEQAPLGRSVGLTLLGAMSVASDERSRERLFERALVTSWHFDAPSNDTAFLRAYALLNLEHRPAALALINGATTPEAVALRALLNGDLPGAAALVPTVKNPLKRFLLAVFVDDLRFRYSKEQDEPTIDPTTVFGEDADWLLLADGRSNDANIWYVDDSSALKYLLDTIYPIAGLGLQSVLAGGVLVGAPVDDVAVDLATMRHVARFVEGADVPICCSAATAGAAAWDLVWLLEGRAESRMRDYFYLTSVVRAAPEGATDAIERYRGAFEGHPLFAAARSEHAIQMQEHADGDTLERWRREARDNALAVVMWSQGQGRTVQRALEWLDVWSPDAARFVDGYGFDYPRRAFWSNVPLIRVKVGGGADALQAQRALIEDTMAYARWEMNAFVDARTTLDEQGKPAMLAALESRFLGHPNRAGLIAGLRPPRPQASTGDPVADAKADVDEDPENWGLRLARATTLIELHGKWEEAAELLLAHPGLRLESPPTPVALSNAVYEAGSTFYWGGHEELAIPFYEIAAKLQTGAASQMTSEIRLNILEGRYQLAMAGSYERARRYPDAYPFRDLLSFMHALGYSEEAWDGFSQVAAAFDNPQTWVSALVGQRLEGLTEPEIRAWLKQPGIRDARFRNNLFAPRYAVLVNSADRMPPEDLGALVAELEGEPAGRVVESGVQERPRRDDTSKTIRVRRSALATSASSPPVGTRVKSEFAFFGTAYAAMRHGHFDVAVKEFQAMAEHYTIESDSYSFALPYYAWAAAKTGDSTGIEEFVNGDQPYLIDFDVHLARAFLHGARKDTARARELLAMALRMHPFTDYRPVLVEYQWAEACEWLYQETGDKGFVDMLLAWAVSQQTVQPTHAWPYAVEYAYGRDPARKVRALAMTLYLDPESPRIRDASAKERADAEAWGEKNNPFLEEPDTTQGDGRTARVSAPAIHDG